jgi:hypothetical protein
LFQNGKEGQGWNPAVQESYMMCGKS